MAHPDRGGSGAAFTQLRQAYELLIAESQHSTWHSTRAGSEHGATWQEECCMSEQDFWQLQYDAGMAALDNGRDRMHEGECMLAHP